MPELPEVETIVRQLRPKIRGKRILGLDTDTPRLFRDHKSVKEVEMAVIRKRIKEIKRIGKNIVLVLDRGAPLVLHLMMSGRILLNPKKSEPYVRLVMRLSGNTRLALQDVRKFGRLRLVASPESLVGKDPLLISSAEFRVFLHSHHKTIKTFLLDQRFLAGIGNIYADEILWEAKLHPLRKTDSLTNQELKRLHRALRQVLNLAIKREGTTMRDYKKPDGTSGGYWQIRKAYGREKEQCRRCGTPIKRVKIGARSTFYCPKCQKL